MHQTWITIRRRSPDMKIKDIIEKELKINIETDMLTFIIGTDDDVELPMVKYLL